MITFSYVLTCAAMVVLPGPSFSVIVDQCLWHGRPAGLAAVAGNTTGLAGWAVASGLGLTALISASEVAFVVLKTAGALYLCYLGARAFLRARHGRSAPAEQHRRRASGFRAGLFANVANPKAAVLYLALLPQFLPSRSDPIAAMALLTAVQMAISVSWYVLVVLLADSIRRILTRPAVRAVVQRLSGMVLFGLGIRMATLSRSAL